MKRSVLKVHRDDTVLVTLQDLKKLDDIYYDEQHYQLKEDVPAKHKFTITNLRKDDAIIMHGSIAGKAVHDIAACSHISPENIVHATSTPGCIGRNKSLYS